MDLQLLRCCGGNFFSVHAALLAITARRLAVRVNAGRRPDMWLGLTFLFVCGDKLILRPSFRKLASVIGSRMSDADG